MTDTRQSKKTLAGAGSACKKKHGVFGAVLFHPYEED
jgi:hypothetical protein